MKMFLLKSLYLFVRLVKYINFLLYLSVVGLATGLGIMGGDTAKSIWDFRLIFFAAFILFLIITLFCFLTSKLLKKIKMHIQEKNEIRPSIPLFVLWTAFLMLIYRFAIFWGFGLAGVYLIFIEPLFD